MINETIEQKKVWRQEISAGGIVYRKSGEQIDILLIKPVKARRQPENPPWSFPKGHIGDHTPGETVETAAVREVREEGGVQGRVVEKLGSVKYTYTWDEENIFKIVTFFLLEYVSGDPADHDQEVAEAGWFPLAQAEKLIRYPTDKEIFEKAKRILLKQAHA